MNFLKLNTFLTCGNRIMLNFLILTFLFLLYTNLHALNQLK